jgi:hypothetical protein
MRQKLILVLSATAMFAASSGCKNDSRYVDLNTGRTLSLVKDESTGLMVDDETKKPVYIYVDTKTKDTIYGPTGEVVNGKVTVEKGKYTYAENGEYKIKRGDDYKVEVEKDGDVTIKSEDKKIKMEGETGEVKVKKED